MGEKQSLQLLLLYAWGGTSTETNGVSIDGAERVYPFRFIVGTIPIRDIKAHVGLVFVRPGFSSAPAQWLLDRYRTEDELSF